MTPFLPNQCGSSSTIRFGTILFVLVGLVAGCSRSQADVSSTTPDALPVNVILITVDTFRQDHLSIYGYARDTTPNIDRFFGDKTVFNQAVTSAPCTIPAIRQFLTGRFDTVSHDDNLASLLLRQGYTTGAVVSQEQVRNDGVGKYRHGFQTFDLQPESELDRHRMSTRTAAEVTDHAIEWLNRYASKRVFFLWLHYFDPHDPYRPPSAFDKFEDGNTSRVSDLREMMKEENKPGQNYIDVKVNLTDEDVKHLGNLYDGEVAYLDSELGRLFGYLKRTGLVGRSLIILTADHGERLGDAGKWFHCQSVVRPEIRVPLLVSFLGGKLAGIGHSDVPAMNLDVLPTVMGALQLPYDAERYDGTDLAHATRDRIVGTSWYFYTSIRDAEWKLVLKRDVPIELYHFTVDPEERTNLLDVDRRQVARLVEARRHIRGMSDATKKLDAESIRRLKSLGYIR